MDNVTIIRAISGVLFAVVLFSLDSAPQRASVI